MDGKVGSMIAKLRQAIYLWWIGVHPPFARCLDCETKGLLGVKFASVMPGRLVGHPLTGYGTCIPCSRGMVPENVVD